MTRYFLFTVILFCGTARAQIGNLAQGQTLVRLGNPTGIGVDSAQRLVVFYRAGRVWPLLKAMPSTPIDSNTVLVLDTRTGAILHAWGAGIFVMPHGLTVDRADHVWVTDVGLNQVFEFSADGRLLLKLGTAHMPGCDSLHFNRPTGVAVAPDGSFYISDGYRNSRVVKFSADGHYLFEWGRRGHAPGSFHVPHGLALDAQGNVYVADRENRRIEVFDPQGKLIRVIRNKAFGRICAVAFDPAGKRLVVVDDKTWLKLFHRGSTVFVLDTSGVLLKRLGRSKGTWYHTVAVDRAGEIFVGDILGNRVIKAGSSAAGRGYP